MIVAAFMCIRITDFGGDDFFFFLTLSSSSSSFKEKLRLGKIVVFLMNFFLTLGERRNIICSSSSFFAQDVFA
jgi:hypothetical protein